MNRPELYQRTVDILVNAYFEDTLRHCDCAGCAVGNIIAANNGVKVIRDSVGAFKWSGLNHSDWYLNLMVCPSKGTDDNVRRQIENTGYSVVEILKIEESFESVFDEGNGDKWIFDGLSAVIDCLDEIHENKDTEVTTSSKRKFNKAVTCK